MIKIAFTGHRPNGKGMGGYEWNSDKNKKIRKAIQNIILDIMKSEGSSEYYFISGGALGVDQFAFSVVNKLKQIMCDENLKIINEVAIPFLNQPKAWFNGNDVERYHNQLNVADEVTYVDTLDYYKVKGQTEGEYHPAKMQQRNKYMVDNCDILIAVWNGNKKGGTYNCLKYAEKIGKRIIYINPKEIQ